VKIDCGWAGKLLWVDLSSERRFLEDTDGYLPMYLGGRGLAAKIQWDHFSAGGDGYEEDNLLMFMTGPLGGTLAPGAGRGYVFGVSPQAYPPHYTRSGFGGQWSAILKFAGYDGLIIKGKASSPSILLVDDQRVEVRDGRKFWGLDAIETQKALRKEFGDDVGLMVIGPAGENLVRIATIQSGANSAAGQGGFGAVMGSKNIKAIVIRGSGGVKVANIERLLSLRNDCVRLLASEPARPPEVDIVTTYTSLEWNAGELIQQGKLEEVTMAYTPCTGCPFLCRAGGMPTQRFFKNVPGEVHPSRLRGAVKCAESNVMGWGGVGAKELEHLKEKIGRDYRFNAGFRAGFETVNLADRYGVNIWEFYSLQMWLTECKMAGIDLEPVLGMPFDEDGPLFWQTLLRKIAYREGIGAVFGEGMARASEQLGNPMKEHSLHAAFGFTEHGLGTYNWGFFPFPYWIPVVLMWSTDTRDPMSDTGHKYCIDLALNPEEGKTQKVAERFYGAKNTLSPRPSEVPDGAIPEEMLDIAYSDKEKVVIRHQNRAAANGSLILCDGCFPLVLSPVTPERFGDTAMEAKLLEAVTGLDIDEVELDRSGEVIFNLERAIAHREGRKQADDENFVKSLAVTASGDWTRGIKLDEKRYSGLLKRYYMERGWDPETGFPTKEKLLALGLSDVADLQTLGSN